MRAAEYQWRHDETRLEVAGSGVLLGLLAMGYGWISAAEPANYSEPLRMEPPPEADT